MTVPVAETISRVRALTSGIPYTEEGEVLVFDRLRVRFIDKGTSSEIQFDGSDQTLYETITGAF